MSRQVLEGLATTAMEGRAVTLEQMLVAGTPESNLMAEMFTASQEPCGFPPWLRLSLALGCC